MTDTIPNWHLFGAHYTTIDVHSQKDNEGTIIYNSSLTFCLDDGTEPKDNVDDQKWITIFTDIFEDTAEEAAYHTLNHMIHPFGFSLGPVCMVFDEEGNNVRDIDLQFLKETYDIHYNGEPIEEIEEESDEDNEEILMEVPEEDESN